MCRTFIHGTSSSCLSLVAAAPGAGSCKWWDGRCGDVGSSSESHPVTPCSFGFVLWSREGESLFLVGMPWYLCLKRNCCCLRQILCSGVLLFSSASHELKLSESQRSMFWGGFVCVLVRKKMKTLLAAQIKRGKSSHPIYQKSVLIETLDHLMAILQLINYAQQHNWC